LALLLPVGLAARVKAQSTSSDTLLAVKDLLEFEQVLDPQISPDGARIIYTRRWVNQLEDKWESALWTMNADGSRNRFLIKGSNARWSPEGTRILFLGEGEPRGTQLFVRWMDAEGATTQVTRTDETPANPAWSPDGKSIAFAMLVPDEPRWAVDLPPARDGAKWTKAPRIVDDLHYRRDGRGFITPGYMHLFVVSADGGTARELTPGKWSVGARSETPSSGGGFDWTPDGKTIVFDGLKDTKGDNDYRSSRLYSTDLVGRTIRELVGKPGYWAGPRVSPDGKLIAFAGHDSTDATFIYNRVQVVGIDGSGMRNLQGDYDREPGALRWAPDGTGIYFASADHGSVNVHFASLKGGVKAATEGTHTLSLGSIAGDKDLSAVGVLSTSSEPGEVAKYSLRTPGRPVRLTSVNRDVLGNKRLGAVEEMWYASSGGARVQGWIVKPPSFSPARKYPLVLEIHGGPFGDYTVAFNDMFQTFAANGFVVLYTNPRGSTGYGQAFAQAINFAYPSVDYDDLMVGVDSVIRRGYVDTTRMYVGGCSGGGVLSSWVIGHTKRFAAAAVRCPVIDWISMAGQTDIPLFTYSFFKKPFWDDPSAWLKQSSLMYVGNITTPTLLMTGELDRRTPMPQTEEFFAALKMRGVPARILRFQEEYHGTGSKPTNAMRTLLYMMSWYNQWGGGKAKAAGQ
jgi:dipeptidyl aminopeptidase/acylaminoacyl peptidase